MDRERIQSHENTEEKKLVAKVVTDQLKRQDDKEKQTTKETLEGFDRGMELYDRIEDAAEDDNNE